MARSKQMARQKKRSAADMEASKEERGAQQQKKPRLSEPIEDSASEQSSAETITKLYGVAMPTDFYRLWDLVTAKGADLLSAVGLRLTGAYDVLAGKFNGESLKAEEMHLHGRRYNDPPEMMTVIESITTNFRIGYFRDDPSALPVGVVSGGSIAESDDNSMVLLSQGDNIFTALSQFSQRALQLQGKKKKDSEHSQHLRKLLYTINTEIDRLDYLSATKLKGRTTVTDTLHKYGIVVPMDATGVGYRELPETNADLVKLLKRIEASEDETSRNTELDKLQEIITLVNFANDECDYGMGLELGVDLFLFASQKEYHKETIRSLLSNAYSLLGRNLYSNIVNLHLDRRNRNGPISMLDSVTSVKSE